MVGRFRPVQHPRFAFGDKMAAVRIGIDGDSLISRQMHMRFRSMGGGTVTTGLWPVCCPVSRKRVAALAARVDGIGCSVIIPVCATGSPQRRTRQRKIHVVHKCFQSKQLSGVVGVVWECFGRCDLASLCLETFPPENTVDGIFAAIFFVGEGRLIATTLAANTAIKRSHWFSGGVEWGYEPQEKKASPRLIFTPHRGQTALANII